MPAVGGFAGHTLAPQFLAPCVRIESRLDADAMTRGTTLRGVQSHATGVGLVVCHHAAVHTARCFLFRSGPGVVSLAGVWYI